MLFDQLVIVVSLLLCGVFGSYYDIPAYYGHFSLRFFDPAFILAGKMVRLEYHFEVDANYQNDTLFIASPAGHCVYQYSVASKVVEVLVGHCGLYGDTIGAGELAEFNGISSLAYFKQPSVSLLKTLDQDKVIIVANSSCSLQSSDCILSTSYPTLSIENLRYNSSVSLFEDQPGQPEYLYLADTQNHCIKRISLGDKQVSRVAGVCGEAGFLDGPLNYNRLNLPSNLGVSREGVIYFFDSGNEYIRIVNLRGEVQTLLLGGCKQFSSEDRTVAGVLISQILCFENWVEKQTENSINHYFDPSLLGICTNQSSQCAQ